MNVSKILSDYEYYPQIDKILRACLNFPIKKYDQVIFAFSSGLFPRFHSSDDSPLSSS